MPSPLNTRRLCRAAAGLLALGLALPALADEHGGGRPAAVPLLPRYQTECSACHLAYPPGLLPAAAWQRVMQNLPRHYGTDASLDAPTAATLQSWLLANAATGSRAAAGPGQPPEDRITRSAWFLREHGEVAAAVWKRPSVKSPSNCAACHTAAEQGDFRERNIRIPR
jgi:hypothetical protein